MKEVKDFIRSSEILAEYDILKAIMGQIADFLIKIKFPTITIVALLLYFGQDLLRTASTFVSPDGIAGAALIFLGMLLSIVAFLDYRYKEQNESVIKNLNDGIGGLSKALRSRENSFSI